MKKCPGLIPLNLANQVNAGKTEAYCGGEGRTRAVPYPEECMEVGEMRKLWNFIIARELVKAMIKVKADYWPKFFVLPSMFFRRNAGQGTCFLVHTLHNSTDFRPIATI